MIKKRKKGWPLAVLMMVLLALLPDSAGAFIYGDAGILNGSTRTFNLTAKDGYISLSDGTQAYMWGYMSQSTNYVCPNATTGVATTCVNPFPNVIQYPGPTLIVNQGETVVVNLTNSIPTVPGNTAVNTSIVFPGQTVTTSGGVAGLLTQEAASGGGTVQYTFVATQPGTYTYYSGTETWLQVEMGLVGAIVVRPNNVGTAYCPAPPANPGAPNNSYAYCIKNGYYDHEYLFLTSEMDTNIHSLIQFGQMPVVDNSIYHPNVWFFNGRNYPDSMSIDYASWLPSQPYSATPAMHPLESVLLRIIGGGRDLHPFHTHGQNHSVIARNGRLLQSGVNAGFADMPISDYTTTTVPGETADAIWGPWTGKYLNWDIWGVPASHNTSCTTARIASGPLTPLITFLHNNQPALNIGLTEFDATTSEWCTDHNKKIPVLLPSPSRLSFGVMYGGTPYIGQPGELPPIDPTTGENHSYQNPLGGLSFMWHSHSERELTTNNVFIGGMATEALVLPYHEVVNGVDDLIIIP